MEKVNILGANGQHATDLLARDILPVSLHGGGHVVSVPIAYTNQVILQLLEDGLPQQKIVNLAGVMTTSPNAISNLHFLFGPGADKGLKVAQAGKMTPLVRTILDRSQARGIAVIETTRTEHDRKMAIIQGLSHLFLIILGSLANIDSQIKQTLIDKWKTPVGTVTDMIFANSFAEEIALEFFELLPKHAHNIQSAFREIVERHLNEKDIRDFSTPNFDRIIQSPEGSIPRTTQVLIDTIRERLNTDGRRFLRDTVTMIRSN